jgi:uncharacterized protein (DUF885 family)
MRKGPAPALVFVTAVAAASVAIGCSERTPAPPSPTPPKEEPARHELPRDAKARLDVLMRDNLDAELAESPVTATWLGAHGHDDAIDDVRLDAQVRTVQRLRALLDRVRAIDDRELDPARAVDRWLLERRTENALYDLTELRPLERNPVVYVELASGAIGELLTEDTLTPDRLRALTERLWQIRRLLDEARRNLRGPTAELAVRKAIELGSAAKGFLAETLPKAVQPADVKSAENFRAADGDATRALDDFVGWLSRDLLPRAHGDFALGRERLLEKLKLAEGLEGVTPEQLVALGERELKEARRRYDEAARQVAAGRAGADPLKIVEEDHAKPDELMIAAQANAEAVTDFVRAQKWATLPEPARPKVLDLPPALWGFAQLSVAGPLEPKPRDGYLYVDPVDKAWPEKRKQEHLRAFNRPTMVMAFLHDLPGQYVLNERNRRAPTTMLKLALAPTLVEGWPGYAERALLDAGFAPGDARVRLVVERAAMLRAARLVAAVRLHALGAKLDDVAKLLADEAYCDDYQARREAERAALDPWVLYDALGRVEIEKLRDDWRAAHDDASLGAFHDALLAHGTPPVTLLRKLLLPGDKRSPL